MKTHDSDSLDSLDQIYTPLSKIKSEVIKRWNDRELEKKLEQFWGDNKPSFAVDEPKAFICRDIISPNMEFRYFHDLAPHSGLNLGLLEYSDNKFVTKNPGKYYLAKMFFLKEKDKQMEYQYLSRKIIDFNKFEGENFRKITTCWGESLIDFHHKLLYQEFPETAGQIHDFSQWFNSTRYVNECYYTYYLSLFIRNGVLFENFLLKDKAESEFFETKIKPSIKKLDELFGLKPLIFPLLPIENEQVTYWWSYPDNLLDGIDKKLETNQNTGKNGL